MTEQRTKFGDFNSKSERIWYDFERVNTIDKVYEQKIVILLTSLDILQRVKALIYVIGILR